MTTEEPETQALEAQASIAEYQLLRTLDALAERRRLITERLHAARDTLHAAKVLVLALGAVGIASILTVFVARSLRRPAARH